MLRNLSEDLLLVKWTEFFAIQADHIFTLNRGN